MNLYDFQDHSIAEIREHFRAGLRSVLWYLPTGGGKSTASGFMLHETIRRGRTGWFIVHRRELLHQTERLFASMGIDYGVIASNRDKQMDRQIQICSIQTLMRRLGSVHAPDLMIQDEAHHLPCASWSKVITQLAPRHLVGLSASPIRHDGRGLSEYFQAIVKGPSPGELIERGYLSPFRVFAPPSVDLSGLHIRAGDYAVDESARLMDKPTITGSAVAEYRKHCDGKRALIFCVSVEHSKHVAQQFRDAGYTAAHIDGMTDDTIRDAVISDFERGAIQILSNVDVCSEGLSINAIECIILLRPTQSLGLYIQQVGRGLRTWPGKQELILLDHVGSTSKFGFIDEDRDWQLTTDERKRRKKSIGVKICPQCFSALKSAARRCECGHIFGADADPRQIAEQQGELEEVTAPPKRRKDADAGKLRTLAELIEFGKIKGYNAGWAHRLFEARRAKDAREKMLRLSSGETSR